MFLLFLNGYQQGCQKKQYNCYHIDATFQETHDTSFYTVSVILTGTAFVIDLAPLQCFSVCFLVQMQLNENKEQGHLKAAQQVVIVLNISLKLHCLIYLT